jgi:hypothetical protein
MKEANISVAYWMAGSSPAMTIEAATNFFTRSTAGYWGEQGYER